MFVTNAFIIALAVIPSILAVPVPGGPTTTSVTQPASKTNAPASHPTDEAK
ncbi:hypothetical protein FRC19_001719 [Serendipita sp. 401]|nr:hypothetical protein FRC19_001719 [Serendipita sp. 401]